MTAKTETAIWLALKSRISTLPGGLPIAWPGQTFTPPGVSPYLRVGRASASPLAQFIDNAKPHWRTGFVIVSLVQPLGQDVSVYDQIAAGIAEHFVDGTQMHYGHVCVTVPEYPHVQEGYEDNGFWTVPVSIPWRCFA